MFWRLHWTLYWRLSSELIAWFVLFNFMLMIPLVLGQILRLRQLFWPLHSALFESMVHLTLKGTLILLELSIPLALFFSTLLCFRRWRARGLFFAYSLVGGSSRFLFLPVCSFGLLAYVAAYTCAHHLTPQALQQAQNEAQGLFNYRWRSLLPQTLGQLSLKPSESEASKRDDSFSNDRSLAMKSSATQNVRSQTLPLKPVLNLKSTWLIEAKEEKQSLSFFICEHGSARCVSGWWLSSDESQQHLVLHDLTFSQKKSSLVNLKAEFDSMVMDRPPLQLNRVQQTFGPPNSLNDDQLNLKDVHQLFIYHKRNSLPWSAFNLALLAAYIAFYFETYIVILFSSLLLLFNFGGLRMLELLARSGYISPFFAAWCPTLCLFMVCIYTGIKLGSDQVKRN